MIHCLGSDLLNRNYARMLAVNGKIQYSIVSNTDANGQFNYTQPDNSDEENFGWFFITVLNCIS